MEKANEITYGNELLRKSIHLSSLSIPIVYYYISRTTALSILVPLAVTSVALDMGRHYLPVLNTWYNAMFRFLLRPHELDESRKLLNGASWVLIAAVTCVFLFPKL